MIIIAVLPFKPERIIAKRSCIPAHGHQSFTCMISHRRVHCEAGALLRPQSFQYQLTVPLIKFNTHWFEILAKGFRVWANSNAAKVD